MLGEADYGMTDAAFQGAQGRFKGDETLLVKFFKHPHLNTTKSQEEGRPIYDDKDYISIMIPGNKDCIIVQPATHLDKQRFAEHWRRYEARISQENIHDGTLLDQWPGVTRSMAEELKFFNVFTVEQLASLSDANSGKIMGINALREKAKAYLLASKDNKAAEALVAANAKIEELMKAVKALQEAQDED